MPPTERTQEWFNQELAKIKKTPEYKREAILFELDEIAAILKRLRRMVKGIQ